MRLSLSILVLVGFRWSEAALPPLPEHARVQMAQVVATGVVRRVNSSLVSEKGEPLPATFSLETSRGPVFRVVECAMNVESLEKGSTDLTQDDFLFNYRHILLPRGMVGATGQHRGIEEGSKVRVFATIVGERDAAWATTTFRLVEPNGIEIIDQATSTTTESPFRRPPIKHSQRGWLDGTYEVVRTLTKDDCPWLDADIPKGTRVTIFHGHTYGVISRSGVAVTMGAAGDTPFFEVPRDALSASDSEDHPWSMASDDDDQGELR